MFKDLICLLSLAMLLSVAFPSQQIQAGAFSLAPIQDGHVCNDSQYGPDQAYNTDDIHIRNQPTVQRCRVGYLMYDISNLKKPDQVFSNVSLSILGYEPTNIIVYGVIESLDHLFVNLQFTTLTWNSVPAGVQNEPTLPINSPVALDYSDLTEQLIPTFRLPAKGVRESTQPSQALTGFLNSDSDGVIVLLLAPAAEGDNGIIRSIRYTDGGARLEGELGGLPTSAYDPNPDDEVEDVARDVVLSWTSGSYADKHNVYFGTVFDDVNEANEDDLTGILVSKRQDPNTYPVGPLDLGQTYYWRVDEVNALPDTTIYKGKTWSFTVESIAFPISGGNITASASSSSLNMGPEKTIDESGLHDNDQHYAISTDMWRSDLFGPQPTWIKYQFDKEYKLHEMWVWNSNQLLETAVGLGMKSVTIEYSLDDSSWTQLDNVPDFNQATGSDDYTYNTTLNFDDLVAKYVRITANSNWGGLLNQYGLSEVRLFYIPLRARLPQPASGETGVALDAVLSWRAGRNAALHEVYFSSDMAAVENNIALVDTISQNSYDLSPLGLELGKTYYWKVNEVNEATTPAVWQGEVWSFTAQEYLVVEDFESYDDTCNRIFYAWVDGFGHSGDPECGVAPYSGNITGSTVGNFEPPFAERSIFHEGGQSMPFGYDNTVTPYYSETQRQWVPEGDWTKGGASSLTVWFYGQEGNNIAEQFYITVEDSAGNIRVVSHTDLAVIQTVSWQEWNIPFTSFAGVDMTNVKKMYIGIGNRTAPAAGGTGKLYIDDIRLYPQ